MLTLRPRLLVVQRSRSGQVAQVRAGKRTVRPGWKGMLTWLRPVRHDVRLDFVTGDEIYGACTKLRTFLEEDGQAYVLRIRPPSRSPSAAAAV